MNATTGGGIETISPINALMKTVRNSLSDVIKGFRQPEASSGVNGQISTKWNGRPKQSLLKF